MSDIKLTLLQNVRIASPCDARWDEMEGDDKVRHCAECDRDVHNFSAMTGPETEAILRAHFGESGAPNRGRLCTRLYQRADGTMLLADCPKGLAAVRERARRTFVRCAAAVGGLVATASAMGVFPRGEDGVRRLATMEPFATVARWLAPAPPVVPMMGKMLMGEVCVPPPPANNNASNRASSNATGTNSGGR